MKAVALAPRWANPLSGKTSFPSGAKVLDWDMIRSPVLDGAASWTASGFGCQHKNSSSGEARAGRRLLRELLIVELLT